MEPLVATTNIFPILLWRDADRKAKLPNRLELQVINYLYISKFKDYVQPIIEGCYTGVVIESPPFVINVGRVGYSRLAV